MLPFECEINGWTSIILNVDHKLNSFFPCFSPLFVTWKKAVNGGEPRLRGCIGTLEARDIITGFRDYALTRYIVGCIVRMKLFFCGYICFFLPLSIGKFRRSLIEKWEDWNIIKICVVIILFLKNNVVTCHFHFIWIIQVFVSSLLFLVVTCYALDFELWEAM